MISYYIIFKLLQFIFIALISMIIISLIRYLYSKLLKSFVIKVKNILDDYFLKGGYPEFYEGHENDSWSVIAKIMRDDYFQRIITLRLNLEKRNW